MLNLARVLSDHNYAQRENITTTARRIGISHQALTRLVSGQGELQDRTMVKIIRWLFDEMEEADETTNPAGDDSADGGDEG